MARAPRDPASPRFPQLADMVLVLGAPARTPSAAPLAADPAERDLLVDRFEVTDGEFVEFLARSGYVPADPEGFLTHLRRESGRVVAPPESERDLPVRHVSLDDARAFAAWRGKQIPTEREWMRACPSLLGGVLPWRGRAVAGACNSVASRLSAPLPVGSYELGRAPTGCYDMIGNVREWSATIAPRTQEKVVVLGGSFRRACVPEGAARRERFEAWRDADPTRDLASDPWHEEEAAGVRADDLGFRCVVSDAKPRLDAALEIVEQLAGAERTAAIDELLRVGAWTGGPNYLLPFVRERAFERRIRWAVDLTQRDGAPLHGERVLLLGPEPAAGDRLAAAELLVLGERTIARIAIADGSVVATSQPPLPGGTLQGEWLVARGGPALWSEDREGRVALLEPRSGRRLVSEPAPDGREVVARRLAGDERDLRGAGAWIVQQLDVARDRDPPLVRILRFGDERVDDGALSGELLATPPAPAGRDGLLVALHHKVEVELPLAGARQDPLLTAAARDRAFVFEWASLELIRTADLGRADRWFIAHQPHAITAVLPLGEAALRWIRWRFVPERPDAAPVELDTPEELTKLLVATTRPQTYLVNARLGRFLVIEAAAGRITPPRALQPEPSELELRLLTTSGDERCDPYLVAASGASLWRIAGEPARLERAASGLSIPSALSWSGVDDDQRHLVVATSDGRWLGVDLERGGPSFALATDDASIHSELLVAGGEPVLASQTTSTSGWLRSPDSGRLLDDFGVARAPIAQVLAIGEPARPVVLFDDGWLVALGAPEPESARLLADFLDRAGTHDDGAAATAGPRPGGR